MPRTGAQPHDNLPPQRGRLIGRERELREARELVLGSEGRLVTLTGAGGCGKTRLALQLARNLRDEFPDGVWLVELARLAEPALIPQVIASTLKVHERRGQPLLASIIAALVNRQLLIVLDNCEHVIGACAETAECVLNGCPGVRVLATSREHLRIAHEVTWRVPSLALPTPRSSADEAQCSPAVQLFVERARAVRPEFVLSSRTAPVAGAICTQLGGLPLAIELAAARVRTMGVEQIAERLQDTFGLLVGGSRTAAPHQQTLRATLDWSHALLLDGQQTVFRRLAVFAGSWSLEAAESVCADDRTNRATVLESITRLIDLSLVQVADDDERTRHWLLEPVRQYALERLVECGELSATRRRHADFYRAFAETSEPAATAGGPERSAATEALHREYANLQIALRWCLDVEDIDMGLRLARSLHFFWGSNMPPSEGLGWLNQLLACPQSPGISASRALALVTAGRLATQRGRYAEAHAFFELGVPLARLAGDTLVTLAALQAVGVDSVDRGNYEEGQAYFDEALVIARAVGDRISEVATLTNLIWLNCLRGDYAVARSRIDSVISLGREIGDVWTVSWTLLGLGFVACMQADLVIAREALVESISGWSRTGELYGMAWSLDGLGQVALAEGNYAEAKDRFTNTLVLRHELGNLPGIADCLEGIGGLVTTYRRDDAIRLAGAAEALREALSLPLGPMRRELRDRWLVPGRFVLGERATDLAWARGRSMHVDDAVKLALALADATPTLAPRESPLTAREHDVAALVAKGLSNRQIAEQLVIAERTAAAHIEHILAKLNYTSRTQIGIWAAERGLTAVRAPR